jgi:hypothetical protein
LCIPVSIAKTRLPELSVFRDVNVSDAENGRPSELVMRQSLDERLCSVNAVMLPMSYKFVASIVSR